MTPKLTVLAVYGGIFTLVVSIVAAGYRQPQPSDVANATITQTPAVASTTAANQPSVDELVATDVAANLAEQTNMPVAANVAELSASLSVKTELAQVNETLISKPQIIQPTASSREITTYKAVAGDTVQTIAASHNVSAETIKWANNLMSDAVEAGRDIIVPPIDGVVYTVKAGDTPEKLAATYKADHDRIVAFNDLELEGMTAGKKIIIPAGVLPEDQRPGYRAPIANSYAQRSAGSVGTSSGGYTISRGLAGVSAGNKYAFGNCTYYAYERRAQLGRPVGSFWGNANTWGIYAQAAGYTVNGTPATGAVLVDLAGYYGHVAIVEEVFSDGSIRISEMNYYGGGGGFNIVSGRTISAGQAKAYQYVH